jgi:leucyl aminopeptidase
VSSDSYEPGDVINSTQVKPLKLSTQMLRGRLVLADGLSYML